MIIAMLMGSSRSAVCCRVLPIAPSTYHAQAAQRADPSRQSARAQRDAALLVDIKRVWDANFQVYGVRKVWQQLRREAIAVPRCQVARLMKRMSLAGAVRGRTVKTTISNPAAPCPLDRVNRQFRAPAQPMATRHEREHQRPSAPVLPEGHGPERPYRCRSRSSRCGAEREATQGACVANTS